MPKKETARDRALARKAKKLSKADTFRSGKKGYGLKGGTWRMRRGIWRFIKD